MTLKRTPLNRTRSTPRRDKHPIDMPGAMKQGRVKASTRDNPKHRAWVRSEPCVLRHTGDCSGPTEAMHVRTGTDGGTGLKPSDKWVMPGCVHHHKEQHRIGEKAFELRYGINMKAIARSYWMRSPYRSEG